MKGSSYSCWQEARNIEDVQDERDDCATGLFCPDCNGRGYLIVQSPADGQEMITAPCPFCEGSGRILRGE